MKLGGAVGYRVLCWLKPPVEMKEKHWNPVPEHDSQPRLSRYFGPPLWAAVADKVVIDYGCGTGADAIELARHGARRVVGIDRDPRVLVEATDRARNAGVSDRCTFDTATSVTADVVVSCDTFEHVDSLDDSLGEISRMLAPGGVVWASFGPPWYHPKGGHIFAVCPWAHLLFTEAALTRWRSAFTRGPVTSFQQVGLNRMSVGRFIETVNRSPLAFDHLELVPIRKVRSLGAQHVRLTRELVTSVVKCRLVRRTEALPRPPRTVLPTPVARAQHPERT
jgi:SAM-dependent methyltransferase